MKDRFKILGLHCPDCLEDREIFCPRNPDAKCLICGKELCAGHIGPHLQKEHCVSLDFSYCRNDAHTTRK
jgi:ribosomal protein S27E